MLNRCTLAFISGASLIAVVAAAVVATVVFRDTRAPQRPLFDPVHAHELAHASLISTTSLPGSEWRVTAEDVFVEPASLSAEGPVCADTRALLTGGAQGRLGRAQRRLELPGPPSGPTGPTVIIEVHVYDETIRAEKHFAAFGVLARDGRMAKCLAALRDDSRLLSTIDVAPSVKPLANSAAFGFERQFRANNLDAPPFVRSDDVHAWRQSNVILMVSYSAGKDRFDATTIDAALKSVEAGAKRASQLR